MSSQRVARHGELRGHLRHASGCVLAPLPSVHGSRTQSAAPWARQSSSVLVAHGNPKGVSNPICPHWALGPPSPQTRCFLGLLPECEGQARDVGVVQCPHGLLPGVLPQAPLCTELLGRPQQASDSTSLRASQGVLPLTRSPDPPHCLGGRSAPAGSPAAAVCYVGVTSGQASPEGSGEGWVGRGVFFAAQGNLSGSCGQLEVPEARPHGARGEGVPRRSPACPHPGLRALPEDPLGASPGTAAVSPWPWKPPGTRACLLGRRGKPALGQGGLGTCFPVPWGLAGRLHQGTGPGWRWGPHSRCRGAQWNSGTPPGSRGSGQVRGVWVPVGITCGVTPGDSCDQFSQWEGASSPCPQLPFPICSARACLRHAGLRGASSEATDAPGAGATGSFRRWAVSTVSTASGLGIRQHSVSDGAG